MNEAEVKELIKKLNSAIESVDEKLKAKGEVEGIVIFRFLKDSDEANMIAFGHLCMHCVANKAMLEHIKSIASKYPDAHNLLSDMKEGGFAI